MIIIRECRFSSIADDVEKKLIEEDIEDFEVGNKISKENITITSDLGNLKIYIPEDLDYFQYDLDDFIRNLASFSRTNTEFDRNIYIMTISRRLTENQYYKLVKYIISETKYCTILE